jgi:DNA-binding FadR family transcriptional regulator
MISGPSHPVPDNVRTRAENESRSLYSEIKTSIVKGSVAAGARLPTERVLSSQYRVARNTVRKTMTRLMDEGLIVRTVGRGTFVAEPKPAEAPAPAVQASFSLPELFEARLLFEPALAELVVERATDADFETFDQTLADMEAAPTWEAFKEAKYALHLAIARASRNRFMEHMLQKIIETRRLERWGRADGHPGPLVLVRQTACRDNAAIIAALRARDGKKARELVHDYLVRTLFSVSNA